MKKILKLFGIIVLLISVSSFCYGRYVLHSRIIPQTTGIKDLDYDISCSSRCSLTSHGVYALELNDQALSEVIDYAKSSKKYHSYVDRKGHQMYTSKAVFDDVGWAGYLGYFEVNATTGEVRFTALSIFFKRK